MKRWLRASLLPLTGLLLLSCSSQHEPAPVTSLQRTTSFHDYQQSSLSAETYEVRPGDTLYSIAFRANMDLREITRLNNLSEPYVIYPGQELRLRQGSSASTSTPVSRSSNNNTSPTQRNDLSEPVVSRTQREYGETGSSTKAPEIQPIRPVVPSQERAIASADIRWQWPTNRPISRRFSTQEPMNRGLEFSGQRGDPIVAAAAGKVVYVGSALRGYGRLIILKHNDDYITAYGHNDSILVTEQQWVESGQQIATMGSSGRDDVRLRFELRLRGNSVNPENYLPRSR
ncbi:MAG: peptidoglycan DD-metalloendopeptidase family protein [Idiomarina sp.]|nr:peptidoglycan DD-metalloendopeptidase family protein [Idiomarina sp.]